MKAFINKLYIFYSFIILIGCTASHKYPQGFYDVDSDSTIKVLYEISGFNMGSYLGLQTNNNFVFSESVSSCEGDFSLVRIRGTYIKKYDSILVLFPKSFVEISYESFVDKYTYDSCSYDSIKDFKFKSKYHIYSFENKELLLSDEFEDDNDFYSFINYYNQNLNTEEKYYYSFHLSRDDSVKGSLPFKKEILPIKYQRLIVYSDIQAEIINFEQVRKDSNGNIDLRIFLNKGSKDSIWKGMEFFTLDRRKDIIIDSLELNECSGVIQLKNVQNTKIGEIFTIR